MRLVLYVVACIGCAAAPHVLVTGAGGGGTPRAVVVHGEAAAQADLEEELGRLLRDRYAGTRQDYREIQRAHDWRDARVAR
jgi:spermidine synthase